MMKELTATQIIVDEFKLAKTTIHRQIYGKKYPGGGQKLQDLRGPEAKSTAKASGSGKKKVAVVILKRSQKTEELVEQIDKAVKDRKGKGMGKSSSSKTRSAANIRKQSTAEEQKQKRLERALEPEEEDPDMPTKAEIAASKPARKSVIIH